MRRVSKNASACNHGAARWTILRDALLRIAPQDEVGDCADTLVWTSS
jgi:hypothetical protein